LTWKRERSSSVIVRSPILTRIKAGEEMLSYFGAMLDDIEPMEHEMTTPEKSALLFFRIAMAWTFLYAASHQVFDPNFTVISFLSHTKTFHDFFTLFTTPTMAPITTLLVEYGHLLIGLSLLSGLMVRVSSAFGILLMIIYWFAHMDFPYISNHNNFLMDEHLVNAGVLAYLMIKQAGHVFGLDGLLEKFPFVQHHPTLRAAVS
jgi:thiosulfate dehydrogenase [quinone] large subunit